MGRKGYVTRPQCPARGNPWILRVRFPDYHPELDLALLAHGYHIAYIDTINLHGGPKSLRLWDSFYEYVIEKLGLSKMVCLEGVSRGGLLMFTWAKQNPEKIACIYGDTAVCNIRSWPFGEHGKKSRVDWKLILKEFGISETAALTTFDNPIDKLDMLAKNNVPLRLVVGVNDKVVPPTENSYILANRYIQAGGHAEIVKNSWGKEELEGHHFILDNPWQSVEFFLENTPSIRGTADREKYYSIRGSLLNSKLKFLREGKGTVGFLGGSITYNLGWRDMVCAYIQHRFPKTKFNWINGGIPSTDSTLGAFRLEQDIFYQTKDIPDLLFIEFAVNDPTNGRSSGDQIRGMEGIIRHARTLNPKIDIIMLYCADPAKNEAYFNEEIPAVIQNFEKVGEYYSASSINFANEVADRLRHKEFSWENDFVDLHPSKFGQRLYFYAIRKMLAEAWMRNIDERDSIIFHPVPKIPLEKGSYYGGKLVPVSQFRTESSWKFISKRGLKKLFSIPAWLTHHGYLQSSEIGASLSVDFTGNTFGMYVISGPDTGIIEYSIDGSNWEIQDMFTPWSNATFLGWTYILSANLSEGHHNAKIRVGKQKNTESKGYVARIINFLSC